MRFWIVTLAACFAALFGLGSAAQAEVVATFYSQDFGGSFPIERQWLVRDRF